VFVQLLCLVWCDKVLSATVYRAQDIITKQFVAIKLEPITANTFSHLEHEYNILTSLQQEGARAGLPRPLWFGREGSYRTMVLESLGPSLYDLIQVNNAFGMPRVAEVGLQLVSNHSRIVSRVSRDSFLGSVLHESRYI
jgi:serine/threonine protein kinase